MLCMNVTRLSNLTLLAILSLGMSLTVTGQTLIDPSRLSQGIRPDIAAQPLLRDSNGLVRGTLAEENVFAPHTTGDDDIGLQLILKRQDRQEPFSASIDSAEYYTDNAANLNKGAQQDWFYVGGINLGYQPRLAGTLYFDTSVNQHWYRYDQLNRLDYEDGTAAVGFIKLMPKWWNTLWHAHYFYERITQGIDNSPIYQTHNLRVGVQKTAFIDRLNSLNLSLMANLAFDTTPDTLKRNEYSALTGWNFKISPKTVFTLSYRLAYYDYSNLDGRQDWYHNFGATVVYRPTSWCELAATYGYTLNRSNHEVFSYDSQLAGPSVGLKMKF